MKKYLIAAAFVFSFGVSWADGWDKAISKNAGNSASTFKVSIGSTTPVAVTDSAYGVQSAITDIFNNSAYTLWVGSNTSTLQTTGFPILSSTTYTTDGTFTGTLYGLMDSASGSGTKDVRTIYYIKNDALQ